MTPDAMHQQFGEYTAVEIARHVADVRTQTSPSRSWHVRRMLRRAMAGLTTWLTSRLHIHTAPGTAEPTPPHAIPMSH